MKTIWKFPLDIVGTNRVDMPVGAHVISVKTQHGRPTIWAMCAPENMLEQRIFRIVGTGHLFNPQGHMHIGTVIIDGFVWHVFEQQN